VSTRASPRPTTDVDDAQDGAPVGVPGRGHRRSVRGRGSRPPVGGWRGPDIGDLGDVDDPRPHSACASTAASLWSTAIALTARRAVPGGVPGLPVVPAQPAPTASCWPWRPCGRSTRRALPDRDGRTRAGGPLTANVREASRAIASAATTTRSGERLRSSWVAVRPPAGPPGCRRQDRARRAACGVCRAPPSSDGSDRQRSARADGPQAIPVRARRARTTGSIGIAGRFAASCQALGAHATQQAKSTPDGNDQHHQEADHHERF